MNTRLKIFFFIIILLWNLGIYPGILNTINSNSILAFPFLDKMYSGVCHQQDMKLAEVLGFKTLVCSRCAGIYAGVLLASFLLIFIKVKENIHIKFLLLSAAPLILDVIFYHIGLYNYSKPAAFTSGLFFGCAGFYYFYVGLEKLFSEQKLKEKLQLSIFLAVQVSSTIK